MLWETVWTVFLLKLFCFHNTSGRISSYLINFFGLLVMSTKSINISLDDQIHFFLPVFEAYVEKLAAALGQSEEKDYSNAEWVLIAEDNRVGKLLNHHVLKDSWEKCDLFLRREAKLYSFIEERISGLVEKSYKIWVFFAPSIANDFFKNQIDKPKNFSLKVIRTLPYIKLLEPAVETLQQILADSNSGPTQQINKALELLEIGEWFLPESDLTVLDSHLKKSIGSLILPETKRLMKDIYNRGASKVLLEKRLERLFKVGWRYFRKRNELESTYFRKLQSSEPDERGKGLKLLYKKVADYQKSISS